MSKYVIPQQADVVIRLDTTKVFEIACIKLSVLSVR
jgi:hypothetical protein